MFLAYSPYLRLSRRCSLKSSGYDENLHFFLFCWQDKDFVKQLKTFLLDKCAQSSPKQKEKLAEILNHPSKQVGLVLSERLVNIPAQIAVPSYQALQ